MIDNPYYIGTKILSLKDLDGLPPELYLIVTNRTDGKTTFYTKYCINHFFNDCQKFAFLYRNNIELDNAGEKIFKDVQKIFFPKSEFKDFKRNKGMYHEFSIDTKMAGYALSLNNSDKIKKMSHLFSDIDNLVFDEFQSETNTYLPDEIGKFLSILTSIKRGQGKQNRNIKVFMLSNPVSVLNPYYHALGIAKRLKSDTKFLKGHGFVLQHTLNKNVAKAAENSGIFRAFGNTNYLSYVKELKYLNDNNLFIDNLQGNNIYLGTIKIDNDFYSLRHYVKQNLIYISQNIDATYPIKIALDNYDVDLSYYYNDNSKSIINILSRYFKNGMIRCQNQQCKNALFTII